MIKQYQIAVPKQDLSDSKSGQLISHGSRVVVLSINGTKAKVCRYGNYLDQLVTDVSLLTSVGK